MYCPTFKSFIVPSMCQIAKVSLRDFASPKDWKTILNFCKFSRFSSGLLCSYQNLDVTQKIYFSNVRFFFLPLGHFEYFHQKAQKQHHAVIGQFSAQKTTSLHKISKFRISGIRMMSSSLLMWNCIYFVVMVKFSTISDRAQCWAFWACSSTWTFILNLKNT